MPCWPIWSLPSDLSRGECFLEHVLRKRDRSLLGNLFDEGKFGILHDGLRVGGMQKTGQHRPTFGAISSLECHGSSRPWIVQVTLGLLRPYVPSIGGLAIEPPSLCTRPSPPESRADFSPSESSVNAPIVAQATGVVMSEIEGAPRSIDADEKQPHQGLHRPQLHSPQRTSVGQNRPISSVRLRTKDGEFGIVQASEVV